MKHPIVVVIVLTLLLALHIFQQRGLVEGAESGAASSSIELPEIIGGYQRVSVEERGEGQRRMLRAADILAQTYLSASGEAIALSLVHAGVTRRSLHFPEVCLVGQGWEVREQYTAPVGISFTGKRLVLFRGNEYEAVLYWFKTGDRFTGSFYENSWHWAAGHLAGASPSSTMIRISTDIGPLGEEAAFSMLDDFAQLLAPILLERIE